MHLCFALSTRAPQVSKTGTNTHKYTHTHTHTRTHTRSHMKQSRFQLTKSVYDISNEERSMQRGPYVLLPDYTGRSIKLHTTPPTCLPQLPHSEDPNNDESQVSVSCSDRTRTPSLLTSYTHTNTYTRARVCARMRTFTHIPSPQKNIEAS